MVWYGLVWFGLVWCGPNFRPPEVLFLLETALISDPQKYTLVGLLSFVKALQLKLWVQKGPLDMPGVPPLRQCAPIMITGEKMGPKK